MPVLAPYVIGVVTAPLVAKLPLTSQPMRLRIGDSRPQWCFQGRVCENSEPGYPGLQGTGGNAPGRPTPRLRCGAARTVT
jgi:hypothetical protein